MVAVYAEKTKVAVADSRAAIERDLKRWKATAFGYLEDGPRSVIMFRMEGRMIRLEITLPSDAQGQQVKWRALALYVKARLVAVEAGITTLEDAFMPDIVLPDGGRVGAWLRPQLALAYERGDQPRMLPAPDADRSVP